MKAEHPGPKQILESMNVMQAAPENRVEFDKFGGIFALSKLVNVDISQGLSSEEVVKNREAFGDNVMPEPPMTHFCVLFFGAFQDPVLMILVAAALVSLALGIFGPDAEQDPTGWVEGAAIMIAVFLVAGVTSFNDYSKELQFRALKKFAATMEACTVIRDGTKKTLNPKEIVVGDVVSVRGGDQVFADCVLFDCDGVAGVAMDEAALTGESKLVKKKVTGDCFLLSSTVCASHGNSQDCKAIVIGVGSFSQWGRIQANLDQESVNTPLQDKLEAMVVLIGYGGMISALFTFIVMMIYIGVGNPTQAIWVHGAIAAFIIAVTIVVVAIPEGLPLAVTISLAYSMGKMAKDNNLVKTLQSCETMGNATNICSDKTGTLTQGHMAVVEGWFADKYIDEAAFGPLVASIGGSKPLGRDAWRSSKEAPWLEAMLQNIGINSSGEVTYGVTYFAPPRDKEPLCLPWLADEHLCATKMPAAWGEERQKEARFVQVIKDRPEHFSMTELGLLVFAHKLDYDTVDAKKHNVLKVVPFNSKVSGSSRNPPARSPSCLH
jgi:calcium-translocating P-type ATPase